MKDRERQSASQQLLGRGAPRLSQAVVVEELLEGFLTLTVYLKPDVSFLQPGIRRNGLLTLGQQGFEQLSTSDEPFAAARYAGCTWSSARI